jgi:hypothetical protein
MYIIGSQVYEDEEIITKTSYLSIYEQDPDDYIMEDAKVENEYDVFANEFMAKMKIKKSPF